VSTLTSLARAEAVARGQAQPICTVRHVHVSEHPLVLVPLALAGEANAPLAVMVGDDPRSPLLLVVSQPRNRDQRFEFAAALAAVVVGYADTFLAAETISSGPGGEPRERVPDAPQILVPNRAGIGFVRLLGRSTRFRRSSGDYAVEPAVPVLGRWLSFLSEQAEHPGSCLLLAATEALAQHWASGQSPVEDLNLAALLGWIDPPAGMTGLEAALAAEDPLAWPPAGPVTDPTFDNEVLEPLIAACSSAGGDGAMHRAESALRAALAGQLAQTWRLMWRAVELMRVQPPGSRVAARWQSDKAAFAGYAEYLRDGGPPQPRRDSAVAAARRLSWLERAQASYAAQRALDDPLVMAEYRLTGEAFAGPVTAVEPRRLDCTGKRRKLRPLITLSTGDSLRIEPGATLVSPVRPVQSARVVSVSTRLADVPQEVVLELSGGMGRALTAVPGSVPEVGDWLCYTTLTDSYQLRSSFPAREDTPWTHGGPPPEYVPDEDAAEEWS
jgi:hypothetical protein